MLQSKSTPAQPKPAPPAASLRSGTHAFLGANPTGARGCLERGASKHRPHLFSTTHCCWLGCLHSLPGGQHAAKAAGQAHPSAFRWAWSLSSTSNRSLLQMSPRSLLSQLIAPDEVTEILRQLNFCALVRYETSTKWCEISAERLVLHWARSAVRDSPFLLPQLNNS